MFYTGYKNKFQLRDVLMILGSYVVGNLYLSERVSFLSSLLGTDFNQLVIFIIVLVIYLVFFVISKKSIKEKNSLNSIFIIMGGVTYPLYLIHQNIGFMIFNTFYEHINKYILLIFVIGLMLVMSYFIYAVLEKKIAKYLYHFLSRKIQ